MSVFLRWGIFGILGFAALIYAYNASKSMAEKRAARLTPPSTSASAPRPEPATQPAEPEPKVDDRPTVPAHCADELAVALRAREARNQNEPFDRVMRMQEIVFADQRKRSRLERIATHYFNLEGPEPLPAEMGAYVIRSCPRAPRNVTAAP